MIAKVTTKDNREYYSYVFSEFNPGWHMQVIVFDTEKKKFEMVDVYNTKPSLKRKVFIVDTDTKEWIAVKEIKLSKLIKLKECRGYNWIINNIELINKIKNGKDVEQEYIDKAVSINSLMDNNDWHYVKNEKDVSDLMAAAWGFHDSVLSDIKYLKKELYDDPTRIQILFSGCWECGILLEFERDVLLHFISNDDNSCEILDSNIIFDNGFVYWIDEYIKDVSELTDEYTYIRGRSLKWKMITEEE